MLLTWPTIISSEEDLEERNKRNKKWCCIMTVIAAIAVLLLLIFLAVIIVIAVLLHSKFIQYFYCKLPISKTIKFQFNFCPYMLTLIHLIYKFSLIYSKFMVLARTYQWWNYHKGSGSPTVWPKIINSYTDMMVTTTIT